MKAEGLREIAKRGVDAAAAPAVYFASVICMKLRKKEAYPLGGPSAPPHEFCDTLLIYAYMPFQACAYQGATEF